MTIQTISYGSASAGPDLVESLHTSGFAILRDHPIPQSLLDRLYDHWETFFSSDEKQRYLSSEKSVDEGRSGFYPLQVSETAIDHTTKDIKEFFQVEAGGPIPPQCRDVTLRYRELGFTIGRQIFEWLQRDTEESVIARLSEPLPDMLCDDASLLRILHYPPLQGAEEADAVRAAAHEDINLLTILPVSNQPGLQVLNAAGNWVDVSGNRGDLVINSGDMLREASGGFYPSATHRVVNPGGDISNESRISIPLFLTARFNVKLSERYTSGSYLDERIRLLHRQ
ncbi:MAG: 2OG-Fe(II) oxygenase family protein [Woeseiaceae bacterium]